MEHTDNTNVAGSQCWRKEVHYRQHHTGQPVLGYCVPCCALLCSSRFPTIIWRRLAPGSSLSVDSLEQTVATNNQIQSDWMLDTDTPAAQLCVIIVCNYISQLLQFMWESATASWPGRPAVSGSYFYFHFLSWITQETAVQLSSPTAVQCSLPSPSTKQIYISCLLYNSMWWSILHNVHLNI